MVGKIQTHEQLQMIGRAFFLGGFAIKFVFEFIGQVKRLTPTVQPVTRLLSDFFAGAKIKDEICLCHVS